MTKRQLERAPYDPRLNLYDPAEVRHWAREFGVSERRLMQAIDKTGTGIDALSDELRSGSARSGSDRDRRD
jgi:hypothetical protein